MCCICLHATEVVKVMMVRHEGSTGVSESCGQRSTWKITLRPTLKDSINCVTIEGRLSRPETVVMGTNTLIIGKQGKLLGSENVNK